MDNPFDRDINNLPLLCFVIHSKSLTNEILKKDSIINRLIKLNGLKEVEIIPLPTDSPAIIDKLNRNGLACTVYSANEHGVSLNTSNGSIYNVITYVKNRPVAKLWENIIEGTEVVSADVFASNIGDYLVVDSNDPALKENVAENRIITPEKALELTRILLTAHKRFYVAPQIKVNEGFYYLYRFKNLFKEYQYAWAIVVHCHKVGLSQKCFDYFEGMETRLDFICRAYDKIAYYSMKAANHDTQLNQLYHLAYYVMLITGIFDDLANIIAEFYQLQIKHLTDISLRIKQTKSDAIFFKQLILHNANLCNYLASPEIQNKISAFYPLRDSLQHREFSRGILYSDRLIDKENLFELNKDAAQALKKASVSSNCILQVHKPCLYPLPFINWAHQVIITIVNETISYIDWESVSNDLPLEVQNKITESNNTFRIGVGKFLGWPVEPLYF